MKVYRILYIFCLWSTWSSAGMFTTWWHTPDQLAYALFQTGDYKQAATLFQQPTWLAASLYKAHDYAQAAQYFQEQHTETGDYNYGNALAYLGRYQEAINVYKKILAHNHNHQDARYNLKIVEQLLKDQQQDKQQQKHQQQNKPQQKQQKHNTKNAKNEEQKQMDKQRMQLVPDDPGGFLKQKLWRDHLLKQQSY